MGYLGADRDKGLRDVLGAVEALLGVETAVVVPRPEGGFDVVGRHVTRPFESVPLFDDLQNRPHGFDAETTPASRLFETERPLTVVPVYSADSFLLAALAVGRAPGMVLTELQRSGIRSIALCLARILLEAEEQDLFGQAPLPLWVTDLETMRFLAVNDQACQTYGYSRAEFLAMTLVDIRFDEDRDGFVIRYQEDHVLDHPIHEVVHAGTFRHRRENGSSLMVEVIWTRIHFHGRPASLICPVDVTVRFAAQEALRQSEERFRAIFDHSDVGIAVLDRQGRAMETNAALQRILGTSGEDLVGRSAVFFAYPEDLEIANAHFRELLDGTRDHFRMERPFRRINGTEGWAHSTVSAVRDTAGQVQFAVCLIEDVSARKADEAQRRRLEEQFLQSQKVEAIGRLTGGVAHDFNNILTTVLGHGTLLSRALEGQGSLQYHAQEIVRAANHAAGVTRQLLAFSRKQPLIAVEVSINSVIYDIEEILRHLLPDTIHMVVNLASDAGSILADPVQIKQVILNLVVNARDAMPQGGTVTLDTARVSYAAAEEDGLLDGRVPGLASNRPDDALPSPPKDWVRVKVRDTGIGMSDEVKARLFEPFFTTKPLGTGTGLGLATSYSIIHQSHGDLVCESTPGAGSVFTFVLPRLATPSPEVPATVAPEVMDGGTETVLVVEDTRPLRELVCLVLTKLGYTVHQTSDGEEARTFLTAHPQVHVDVLLTDVVMPQMSGTELAEWVTQRSPDTRVVYMSGHNDDPSLQSGRTEPGFVLLAKPFTPVLLAHAIRQSLSAPPPGAGDRSPSHTREVEV